MFMFNFYPFNLQNSSYYHVFTSRMANSVDPDQLASDLDLHCFSKQALSGFSIEKVKMQKGIQSVDYCYIDEPNSESSFTRLKLRK